MFKQPKSKLTAIGINIYGGGFTCGVLKNFKVLGQWEECNIGAKTFDLNFKGLIPHPLNHDDWPVKDFIGKVDFVYANPPCAPWSSANSFDGQCKEERFKNPKLALTHHTMDAAFQLKPKIFILESVENAFSLGKEFYDEYAEIFMAAGYAVTYFLTDAMLHGSPSRRRRFHFIAHRVPMLFGKPPVFVSVPTVRNAIGVLRANKTFNEDLQHTPRKPHPTWSDIYKYVPAGGHLAKTIKLLGSNYTGPRASFLVTKLGWDIPANTMITNEVIHPDSKRLITMRELLRLATYPDNFKAHIAGDVTRAVLPIIGEFLSSVAKKSIQSKLTKVADMSTPTVVDWRPITKPFSNTRLLGKLNYETF